VLKTVTINMDSATLPSQLLSY